MSETVKIWRCAKCRKWSFAALRPRKHRRWVEEGQPEYDPGKVNWADIRHDIGGAPGHLALCGPFEAWTATKDEP